MSRSRLLAALAGALAVAVLGSGCGGDPDEPVDAVAAPTPPAVTYLRADQWPTGAPFGAWAETGPVDLTPDGGSNAGSQLPLICGEVEFPLGSGARGFTAGGFGRGDELPAAPEAAADQYVVESPDAAAAQARMDVLVRQFRTCAGAIGAEDFKEYPSLAVADGVRVFGRFVAYLDGKYTSKLLAFGRAGRLISVEVLYTGDKRAGAPRKEFEATVRAAMEQLTA